MTARTDYTTDEVMYDAFVQPHGNCKPSGFAEYDSLTGYVTETYAREWTDSRGTRWRKVVTVINLGRPDRGVPVDPDAELQPAKMDKYNADAMSIRVRKARAMQNQHGMRAIITAHMHDRGPLLVREVAAILGRNKERAREHLQKFEGEFYVRLPVNKQRDLWGLVGIHQPKGAAA